MRDALARQHEGNGNPLEVVKLEMLRHSVERLEAIPPLAKVVARLVRVRMGREQELAFRPAGTLRPHHVSHLGVDRHCTESILVNRARELDTFGVVLVPNQLLQIEVVKLGIVQVAGAGHGQEQDAHVVAEFLHLVVGRLHPSLGEGHVAFGEPVEVVSFGRHLHHRIENVRCDLAYLLGRVIAAAAHQLASADRCARGAHVHQLHTDSPVIESQDVSQRAVEDI